MLQVRIHIFDDSVYCMESVYPGHDSMNRHCILFRFANMIFFYFTNFFSDRDRRKSTGDDKRAGRPTIMSDTLVTSVDSCK